MHTPEGFERVGVVVVHGVGDPQPGETVQDFTDSVAAREGSPFQIDADQDHTVRLVEPPPATAKGKEARLLHFFPAAMRRGAGTGSQYVFAEVFWGSASTLPGGWMGVLQGLGNIITGMASVIDGAAPPEKDGRTVHPLARAYNRTVHFASQWMAGPIFALNVLLAAALLLYTGLKGIFGTNGIPIGWAIGSNVVFGVAAAAAGWVLRRTSPWYRPLAWSCVGAGLLWAGNALRLGMSGTPAGQIWELLGEAGVNWLLLVWAVLIVLAGLLVLAYPIFRFSLPQYQSPLRVSLVALALQYVLWVLLVPAAWRMLLKGLRDPDDFIGRLYQQAMMFDGTQWLMLVPLVIVGALTMVRRSRARSRALDGRIAPDGVPRLIVSEELGLAFVAFLSSTVVAMSALAVAAATGHQQWVDSFQALLVKIRDLGLSDWMASALFFVLSFSITGVRVGLDLANDVINYIFWNHAGRRREELPGPNLDASRPIRGRFYSVVRHLVRMEAVDRLIVVAHSQGTVIALDELALSFAHGEIDGKPITFVTMGSPISHLYQHYFPASYPDWQDAQWRQLFARVGRWVHFYRVDDFIGTSILSGAPRLEQHPVGDGSHTDYWRDSKVVDAMLAHQIFAAPAADGKSSSEGTAGERGKPSPTPAASRATA